MLSKKAVTPLPLSRYTPTNQSLMLPKLSQRVPLHQSVLVVLPMLLITGCASTGSTGSPDGFFFGLWNGLTLPLSLIGSFFNDSILIYSLNNAGTSYDIGFCIGLLGLSFIAELLLGSEK